MADLRQELLGHVSAWLRADAEARAQGTGDDVADAVDAHGWLASASCAEAFSELEDAGRFGPMEREATARALARYAEARVLAPARRRVAAVARRATLVDGIPMTPSEALAAVLGRAAPSRARAAADALVRVADEGIAELIEARAEAADAVKPWLARAEKSGETDRPADHAEAARRLLAITEDPARAAIDWLARGKPPETWDALAHLVADDAGQAFAPVGRFRRIADAIPGWRAAGVLASHVRIENAPSATVRLSPRVVAVEAPRDVRIVPSAFGAGALGEVVAAEALGCAVALAWIAPGHPVAWRVAPPSTTAVTLGDLAGQIVGEPRYDAGGGASSAAELERRARQTRACLLLVTRFDAARALGRLEGGPDAAREALEQTFSVSVPRSLAAWAALGSATAIDAFRSRRAAFAAWAALRSRYDEDWYRNPRVAEILQGAAMRGPMLSAEDWTEELGAAERDGEARLLELFD